MARRRSTGLFEAFRVLQLQNELLANPPQAEKPEPTAQELAVKRAPATTAAYEAEYRNRKAKEDTEHAIALENGRREDMFRVFNATTEERKALCRAKPELIPELLADLRRPAPANMEVFERMYSVLK